ncbi:MAG TPA: hypothetical protein VFB62_19380, partial [Polyangiaceae bacterium]|nr:hypothetical protein [Polyangiaceae bacterium]
MSSVCQECGAPGADYLADGGVVCDECSRVEQARQEAPTGESASTWFLRKQQEKWSNAVFGGGLLGTICLVVASLRDPFDSDIATVGFIFLALAALARW